MKPWMLAFALAALVCGCKSTPHPPVDREPAPAFNSMTPNGENSPFNP